MKITMLQNEIIIDGEGVLNFIENDDTFIKVEGTNNKFNYTLKVQHFYAVGINSKFKFIRKLKKILYILKED